MSLHIVLYQPEIPQNTGNIARTCVVIGAHLHIIEPAGFSLEDKMVKRAGLDYWDLLQLKRYQDFNTFLHQNDHPVPFCLTTKGTRYYHQVNYPQPCYLLFGRETAGLPEEIRLAYEDSCIKLPMNDNPRARSLNLSNAVAAVAYEVLRQWRFPEMR
ncbi:tRNA (cytidine(34)-2'-O)-methyltransferase [Anoxynatronum buryatiense]|uniref:Putative tRNA (cytidine(34)-2'-O)-methyltransferase n=1 Tax=Anoxynatronum buryatiense TaxID=489973 RepID=A0AA46AHD6_9CLOT|nr:tRNA (cytidine(34)-2'-O)-methyltransferase [Anoxynatronum buryatiense]SMP38985.1 tRNA (cytidine/uridine-2'-O-)-methyltransferase [Anoxynatronum buryatiense]